MSEGIPKPVRDALAKQTVAGAPARPDSAGWDTAHPSPDLLNAYVEQSLTEEENSGVLAHLAACTECREVVFLTTGVSEEELIAASATKEVTSVRVNAAPEVMHARTAVAAQDRDRMTGGERPRPPRTWWKWAVPAVAAAIVVGVGIFERDDISRMISPPSREMAKVEQPTPALGQPNTAAAPSASRTEQSQNQPNAAANEKSPPPFAQKKQLEEQDQVATDRQYQPSEPQREQAQLSSNLKASKDKRDIAAAEAAKATPSNEAKAAAPAAIPPRTTVAVTSSAPQVQADNADLSASNSFNTQSLAKSALPGNSAAGVMGALQTQHVLPTHWRISSDGHVEHTVGPSTWERVMSAEPVTFHVVATVGPNVWAGGSDGALFHSADGGHEWNRVALAGEQGTIKSIHFDNLQQGSLTTDTGTVWTTSDAGVTWSKQ